MSLQIMICWKNNAMSNLVDRRKYFGWSCRRGFHTVKTGAKGSSENLGCTKLHGVTSLKNAMVILPPVRTSISSHITLYCNLCVRATYSTRGGEPPFRIKSVPPS